MSAAPLRVAIDRLGWKGEGVASVEGARVYVPYALPGEVVGIDRQGERGTLISVVTPSPDRIEPVCRYFTTCGGCAVQAWAGAPYAAWKRGLLIEALSRAGVAGEVAPLVDAHGAGRRRATFHARIERDGRTHVGFMQARSHDIVAIDACPILDPRLGGALPAARAVAAALAQSGKPLDIIAMVTDTGLDLDLHGHGPLDEAAHARLCNVARTHDLARLANHGTIVLEQRKPVLRMGAARIEPQPGAFLQATEAGEAALAARVTAAMAGAKRVADLFCGLGTFALRLAAHAEVAAYDTETKALAAIDRAARATPSLRPVRVETRNLLERPLNAEELQPFDAIVLDPPRAGAEAQMRTLATSKVERVVSVSCDAQTFGRDAAILTAGGFAVERIEPIDQFRYSAHLEIVAAFRRAPPKRKRRLLG